MARKTSVTPSEVAVGPLLVFCQRDYPEYWNTVTSWLREHGQRPAIAGEYDGVNSLMMDSTSSRSRWPDPAGFAAIGGGWIAEEQHFTQTFDDGTALVGTHGLAKANYRQLIFLL